MNLSMMSVQSGEYWTTTTNVQTIVRGRMLIVTGVGTSRDQGKSVAYALEDTAAHILRLAAK